MKLDFTVNDKKCSLDAEADERLLDILRNRLGLLSVKEGCSEGECGACTVLMDGKAVTSCLVLAPQIQDRRITTIEGLGTGDHLSLIQKCFIEEGAVQCGYCSSGMILSVSALLAEQLDPSEEEIRQAISGNICRCSGYMQIIRATRKAANILSREASNGESTHS